MNMMEKNICCGDDDEKTMVMVKTLTELEDLSSGTLVVLTKNKYIRGI
ncbi:hypothetical protein [Acinetobacter sp. SH20PTE14]|nr:hypothetical protein [Acinetobacter sp. SH20PTE14]UIJ75259.1 hypothetical protein LXF01_13770 [Acinetobacter sp. SH20PTE14]